VVHENDLYQNDLLKLSLISGNLAFEMWQICGSQLELPYMQSLSTLDSRTEQTIAARVHAHYNF